MGTKNKTINAVKILTSASICFATSHASFAGIPSGPYLAWVNLHESASPQLTQTIREFLKTQKNENLCGGYLSDWIVYIQKRPTGISNRLVSEALDRQNQMAKRTLAKTLKSFRNQPNVDEGLDGVIAYSETRKPHMISIDTHGKIKKSKIIKNIDNADQVIEAFCSVMPEVYRK